MNLESSNAFTRTGLKLCQHKSHPTLDDYNKNGKYCSETIKTIKLSDEVVKNKQYKTNKDFNLLPNKMTTSTLCLVYTNSHFKRSPMKSVSSHKVNHHRTTSSLISNQFDNKEKCKIDDNDENIQTEKEDGLITLDPPSKWKDNIANNNNNRPSSEIYKKYKNNNIGTNDDNNSIKNKISVNKADNLKQLPQKKATVQAQKEEKGRTDSLLDDSTIKQTGFEKQEKVNRNTLKTEVVKNKEKTNTKNESNTIDSHHTNNRNDKKIRSYSNNDKLVTQRTQEFCYKNSIKSSTIHKIEKDNDNDNDNDNINKSPLFSSQSTFKTSVEEAFQSTNNTLLKDYIEKYSDNQNNIDGIDYYKNCNNKNTDISSKPCKFCGKSYCNNNHKLLYFNKPKNAFQASMKNPINKFDQLKLSNYNSNNINCDNNSENPYNIRTTVKPPSEERLCSKCKSKYSVSPNATKFQLNEKPFFLNRDKCKYSNTLSSNDNENIFVEKTNKELILSKNQRERARNESIEMKTRNVLFKSSVPQFIVNNHSSIPDTSSNSKCIPRRNNNINTELLSNAQSYNKGNMIKINPYTDYYKIVKGNQNTENLQCTSISKDSFEFEPERDKVSHKPKLTRTSSYIFNYDYSIYNKQSDIQKPLSLNKNKFLDLSPTNFNYYPNQEAKGNVLLNNRAFSQPNLFSTSCGENNYDTKGIIERRLLNNIENKRLTYELNSEDMIDVSINEENNHTMQAKHNINRNNMKNKTKKLKFNTVDYLQRY